MKNNKGSFHIIFKYILLQLPAAAILALGLILLNKWIRMPLWISLSIIGLWVSKDLILYFFTWRSYEWGCKENPMIGLQGTVQDCLDPVGYILVRGELWKAELNHDGIVETGENVVIREIRGLTLLVEKDTHQN